MPTAMATTRICSTLNDIDTLPSSPAEPSRPSTLAGTRPVRKSSHEPVDDGAEAASEATLVWSPGWTTRPRTMPMTTAISAVMANQASVFQARRAAPVTSRRLAMRGDDRQEHQRRDDGAQQRHERAADGAEGLGEPVGVDLAGRGVDAVGAHAAGHQAQDDAQHEPDQDLRAERREPEAGGLLGLADRSIHSEKITFRNGAPRNRGRREAQVRWSVGGEREATERALGPREVHGATLRQQVADGRGSRRRGGGGRGHVRCNRYFRPGVPWSASQRGTLSA